MEVALALADRGHEPVLWNASDFPTRQTASIDIQGEHVGWEISGSCLDGGRPPFDVVWFRRPTPPVLPGDMHPGDLPVAQRECRHLLRGLYQMAAPEAFWVNPLKSDPRAALKAPQLAAAVRAGLNVPRTLISNDPSRIRSFLKELRGRTVYKPFQASQWEDEGLMAVLLTSEVAVEDLPSDDTLRLTPGIFQEKIDKAHELRVTIMGAHVVTARLLSQESAATRLDWRMPGTKIRVEPDRLPEEVERACRRLMRDLGIVFGCFDFIVTPEGAHVFLEVNPAGQFLWIEEAQPEIRLLAPFVDFLLARRRGFRWRSTKGGVRHADYYPAACARIEAEGPLHVPPDDREYISSDRPDGSFAEARTPEPLSPRAF